MSLSQCLSLFLYGTRFSSYDLIHHCNATATINITKKSEEQEYCSVLEQECWRKVWEGRNSIKETAFTFLLNPTIVDKPREILTQGKRAHDFLTNLLEA